MKREVETKDMGEKLDYIVRQARKEDMPRVMPLLKAEGWNEVVEHLNFHMEYFPEGVVVAESSTGEIISEYSIYNINVYIHINLFINHIYITVYIYIYIYIYIHMHSEKLSHICYNSLIS